MANMISDDLMGLLNERHDDSPVARVVRALSGHGAVSTAQIARKTGLARSTVSTILGDLKRSGLVVELETRSPGVGRPALAHTLSPNAGSCVGVRLGDGDVRIVLADVAHNVIADIIIPLDRGYRLEKAAKFVKQAIDNIYKEHSLPFDGLLGIGFAVAGSAASGSRSLRGAALSEWHGADLRSTFETVIQKPIFADKESNCAALAEMMWGAAVDHEDFILLKLDHSVSGAVVINGRIVTGFAGAAGEFGHIVIDPRGDLCSCGNRGCLELECSGNHIIALAEKRTQRRLTLQTIVSQAVEGDVGFQRLIEDAAEAAGRGLASVGTILNPRLIVISGALAEANDILLGPLRSSFAKHTLIKPGEVEPDAPRVLIGKYPTNDSCLGAVGLVLRHHGRIA